MDSAIAYVALVLVVITLVNVWFIFRNSQILREIKMAKSSCIPLRGTKLKIVDSSFDEMSKGAPPRKFISEE